MNKLNFRKIMVILIHSFAVWALCGATIAIGRSVTTMELTLIIHAAAAPVFACLAAINYFRNFNYTSPIATAFIFLIFVIAMDAGLVAPVFEKSFEMFKSILGTWIPFSLIFLSVYITGLITGRKAD